MGDRRQVIGMNYSNPIWIVRKDFEGILSHKASHLTTDLGLAISGT